MPTHDKGDNVAKTISLPKSLCDQAEARAERLGIKFSAYAQYLIKRDLEKREPMVFHEIPVIKVTESEITRANPTTYPPLKKKRKGAE